MWGLLATSGHPTTLCSPRPSGSAPPGLLRGLWLPLRQQPCPHFPSVPPVGGGVTSPPACSNSSNRQSRVVSPRPRPPADSGLFSFPVSPRSQQTLGQWPPPANGPHQPSDMSGHPSAKPGVAGSCRGEASPPWEDAPVLAPGWAQAQGDEPRAERRPEGSCWDGRRGTAGRAAWPCSHPGRQVPSREPSLFQFHPPPASLLAGYQQPQRPQQLPKRWPPTRHPTTVALGCQCSTSSPETSLSSVGSCGVKHHVPPQGQDKWPRDGSPQRNHQHTQQTPASRAPSRNSFNGHEPGARGRSATPTAPGTGLSRTARADSRLLEGVAGAERRWVHRGRTLSVATSKA